jgi:hypothetical protein
MYSGKIAVPPGGGGIVNSISYKCASKQAMKISFSVGSKAKASDFDFQSCLLCANPI